MTDYSSSSQRTKRLATFVSTGYNPATDVPNLLAWYRADTTTNAGGFVSQLTDKKGAVQYVQATGTKQPALVSSGSDPNGRDCVVFDNVDDCLTSAGHGAITNLTVFGVVRSVVASAPATGRIWCMGNLADVKSFHVSTNGTGQTDCLAFYANPGTTFSSRSIEASSTTSVYTASTPRIMTLRHNSAAAASATPITRSRLGVVKYSNAGSAATISTINSLTSAFASNTLGSGAFLGFGLYEWMVCNALLTDEQVNAVELYLARYYGLL